MPPHVDQQLQEKILKAAQRLWRMRGEEGLTLRSVAKEAGTTTPTVYKRFRNKEALRAALAERFREQLNEHLFGAKSLEDVCRRYLEFAEKHQHEYQLLLRSWSDILHPDFPQPGRVWLMTKFAERFGGKAEDYSRCFYALFLLSHGAATLLTLPAESSARDEIRSHFLGIAETIIKQNRYFRG
ncbi:MAG TPA: helix-turn-helix domain-containing protein [Dongiaceae bacterium]|nr:helix-turn-helix domain-containing protein [Dongiaceae bacterium]